uniref:Uncharacterized protein n=1 Tax=Ditylenchus dipsaci TaxID=166011 RepID=A0A915DIC8_9BILA
MIAEDWDQSVFVYPNTFPTSCWNIFSTKRYTDFYKQRCLELHDSIIGYFQQFVHVYYDLQAKFSLTWPGSLAHDDPNQLYHSDEQFYQLLKA